jgi:hypothetical protein
MCLLPLLKAWIWISVFASVAGWLLSVVGELNYAGYLVFGAVVLGGLWLGRGIFGWRFSSRFSRWPKIRWRFKHWLPAGFAMLALLVFLGGALYPPTNHAAFTYRTPRVLHWLAEGHWYWIHTSNYRMNDRACGFEWLTTPLLLFTKSDRGLFLINFASFLLLPGLIYSVFTRLGVRPRVAWHWMWLLPSGYNFLLQAGSVANDTFPTVYALAALDFGLRAWATRRVADLWLSVLSASLLIGAKASNLPLLLPWAILIFGLLPLLLRRPGTTLILILLAATVSFLPNAALNVWFCGDWSGLKLERAGMDMKNPIVGIWGNCLLLMKNFVPPFFPQAGWWNESALTVLPHWIVGPMVANFEQGFHALGEMPTEDGSGIGFGLSVLILVSVVAALRNPKAQPWTSRTADGEIERRNTRKPRNTGMPTVMRWCVLMAPWVSLLAYCVKSGIVDAPRLISPYYPMLLPSLLAGARQAEIVRRRWWRVLAWASLLLAFPVIILTPGRPLWPAQTVLEKLHAMKPEQRLIARAQKVYAVYAERSDPLANVRALLPPALTVVGFVGAGDDIDISLWRPYGSRRVEHILLSDSLEDIRRRHIDYAVVGGFNLALNGTTIEAWQKQTGAQVIAQTTATQTVIQGPQAWYVVRFPR